MRRTGDRGFTFVPPPMPIRRGPAWRHARSTSCAIRRRERYDAVDFTLRHTFAGKFEWFAGYTRSARAPTRPSTTAWKTPSLRSRRRDRFPGTRPIASTCGDGLPLPNRRLPPSGCASSRGIPPRLTWWSTAPGFPSAWWTSKAIWWARRTPCALPNYFNINLHLERKFHALHYLWAWRFGYNNLTNNSIPTP